MSKIKFYFILLIAAITVSSCNKDDNNVEVTPPIPFAEQYPKDIAAIEDYLKTNYFTVLNNPGFPDDQDVTISKIDAGQASIYSYLDSPTLPRLTSRDVSLHGITYKLYYLVVREGVKGGTISSGGEYPCNVDGVFAGYKLSLLDGTTVQTSNNTQILFNLDGTAHDGGGAVYVRGWSEGFPQFKTGWLSSDSDGTIKNNGFGAGVLFIPSGLGYYNQGTDDIPAYSPLVYGIKLYALKRYDHDGDGIPSFQEDLGGDMYVNTTVNGVLTDDTDGDGTPNFLDFDDDGDNYATRGEIKDKDGNYYAFDKIPDCSGDQTNPARLKRHLDKNCIKMNQ
ncbi:FKBP-type peptidyl-prolyl cis-trans isomerase [Flavobacterium taihuense]|uniref:peptidylprolyl isomerase n=1 Tax=Flavobacterium taihuense TaxID=2857508 RepID=A0ABS6XZD1_9FLAO|nr:FKBP-type peptidylprolyl isomerase [Flavobacterium taihuense]MBW4361234.1 FKBP-type peptidylprolyl isomerase [Flavobacterium taihuense]